MERVCSPKTGFVPQNYSGTAERNANISVESKILVVVVVAVGWF
jgi:hypothetical protein